MSALPRPDIPPGAHRELINALHDLHHRAGWPSLRRMAAAVGTSHTTVSKMFSTPALPAWGTLELLVETLGGDVARYHELWLRATSSPGDASSQVAAPIAGRRTELATVREHLERGSGLMIVAGEAGIGKTALVKAAAQAADVLMGVGNCLPLSMQAPLMPVSEMLRAVHDVDDGSRLKEAVAVVPPFVRGSLGLLLPELAGDGAAPEPQDEFSRHRLFAAVATCLSRVHALGGLGLLVEDLHWADTATLDLIEHLVAAGVELPIVATWRLDDPDTGDLQREWWLRMRRLSAVTTLDLTPLTRQESGEQCRLLGLDLDEASIDAIHARSRGQPLFTEQLAAQGADTELPMLLADLLDRRLERLSDSATVLTRTLGVADRGLDPMVLAAVTGLEERPLVDGLRELARTYLLAPARTSSDVRLRHPLLAEAVRRGLVSSEAATVHRRLAEVLSHGPGCSPAEVAEHWRGAGDRERELEWRIAAARDAELQWAASQAAEHWLRALEIWLDAPACAGDPPMSRPAVYLAAIDALKESLQFDRAAAMSAEADARFIDLEPHLRAEFLRRAAVFRTDVEGPEVGLELIDEAIRLLSTLPVGVGMVRAKARRHQVLLRMGRFADALDVAREAVADAETVGDVMSQRLMLGHVAWHEAVIDGEVAHASATMAQARSLSSADADPAGAIWLAVIWTDVLLILGAGSAAVTAAGRDALALADTRGIANFGPVLIRYNMVKALADDGRLTEAAALLGPVAREEVDVDRVPIFMARALLDVLGGHLDEAGSTIDTLRRGLARPIDDLELISTMAVVELWRRRPRKAWLRLRPALVAHVESVPPVQLLAPLVLGARALADVAAEGDASDTDAFRAELVDLHRRAVNRRSATATTAHGRALAASWSAELARLDGADSTPGWLVADSEWSSLGRTHEAAYCRWRGAQVAIRDGHGTVAALLLDRAASDAQGHVPLLAAIAATRSSRSDGPGAGTLRPGAAPP